MRRLFTVFGLTMVMTAVPMVLSTIVGGPQVPGGESFAGLDSTYVQLEPILKILALIAWVLWAYIAAAVLLRLVAVVVARHTGSGVLLATSDRLSPAFLRRFVDIAVGGAIVAASLSFVRLASAGPMPYAAATSSVALSQERPAAISTDAELKPTYTVRSGDSLWRIAERELGSGSRWGEIYSLNKGQRFPDGRTLHDPRLIFSGWVLDLPQDSIERPHHEAARAEVTPEEPPAASRMAEEPAPSATARPSEARERSDRPAAAERPKTITDDDAAPASPAAPVVRLPSGAVVATSFACGLLSAELLARMRRRRARRPLSNDDEIEVPEELVRNLRTAGATPTASILDVAADEVAAAWRSHTGESPRFLAAVEGPKHVEILLAATEGPLPPRSGGSLSPQLRFEREDAVVKAELDGPFPVRLRRISTGLKRGLLLPIGHAGEVTALHVAPVGMGLVSISGGGGANLVRQIVLSQVIESDIDDLQIMFLGDVELGRRADVPHVQHNVDWDAASETLQLIQAEFIRRARMFQREGVDDIWSHLASHADEQLPALMLVIADPPAAMRGLIEAISVEGARYGAAVIAVGWRPSGSRLHIDADDDVLELDTALEIPSKLSPFVLDEAVVQDALKLAGRLSDEDETIAIDEPAADEQLGRDIGDAPSLQIEQDTALRVHLPPRNESQVPTPPPDLPAIYCLGPFSVSRDGDVRVKGWLRKSRELLAYLVAHPSGAMKERIWDELWPEEGDPQRLQYLIDRAISRARLQVRTSDDLRVYLMKTEDAWHLEEGSWWVDVFEFERLISEADRLEDPAEKVRSFRRALPLYSGNFCDDLAYAWAEPVRERLRSMFIRASARLAEILTAAAENEEALEVLDRAVQVDVLCEDLWRRAMTVESALGRRAAAADRYERLRRLLARELNVEPDPQSQRLARDIARSGPPDLRADTTVRSVSIEV